MFILIIIYVVHSNPFPPLFETPPNLYVLNVSQGYNRTQTISSPTGLESPYNIFLQDDYGYLYFTHVSVQSRSAKTTYKVCIDINLPFIFLTERQEQNSDIHYTKLIPSKSQLNTIAAFMSTRFPQINDFLSDIYFVTESTFWINEEISTTISFFYLIGYGATYLKYQNNIDGYIGLAMVPIEDPSVNLVVNLYEQGMINNITYSIYLGSQFGYIDSLIYFGGVQTMFLQNQKLQKIPVKTQSLHNWCFAILNLQLKIKNETIIYSSQNELQACISSTHPFISLPLEIIEIIKKQIQIENIIQCQYSIILFQRRNTTILECQSKLPVSEALKYPSIDLQLKKYHIILEPIDYIQKCLFDIENYAKKCTTNLAIQDQFAVDGTLTDILLGVPLLRKYYTYFNLFDQELCKIKFKTIGLSVQFKAQEKYSQFWYYSLLTVLFSWTLLMMTCGVYHKDQMSRVWRFVKNIMRYICGDQESRQRLIAEYLAEEQQQM